MKAITAVAILKSNNLDFSKAAITRYFRRRTAPPSHGANRGSFPLGRASDYKKLADFRISRSDKGPEKYFQIDRDRTV